MFIGFTNFISVHYTVKIARMNLCELLMLQKDLDYLS